MTPVIGLKKIITDNKTLKCIDDLEIHKHIIAVFQAVDNVRIYALLEIRLLVLLSKEWANQVYLLYNYLAVLVFLLNGFYSTLLFSNSTLTLLFFHSTPLHSTPLHINPLHSTLSYSVLF